MSDTLSKIVYVEDEPDLQVIAKLALESIGQLNVVICSSGVEALEVIPELQPDLVLLDVMMPQMDGPSTLNALKSHPDCSHIPIAFMTAKVRETEVQDLLNLGAIGVISKPFDPMTLADQVRKLWQENRDNGQ